MIVLYFNSASVATARGPRAGASFAAATASIATAGVPRTAAKGGSKGTTSTTAPSTTPLYDPMLMGQRHPALVSGPLVAGPSSQVAASPGIVVHLVSCSAPPGGPDVAPWSPGLDSLPAAAPTQSPTCSPDASSTSPGSHDAGSWPPGRGSGVRTNLLSNPPTRIHTGKDGHEGR
ncbi:UNVERIFIED_CONTAM: hypothetical protein FKN15_039252 [Acipenser sinensis]